jgi:hypothetical protein
MRSAFDKLISWTGLLMAAVLIAAGGLLLWANNYIGDQVQDQLVMQDITMPTAEATAELSQADQDALAPYSGSKLDTGDEAKAYANNYILAHMNAASDGQTYSEVSGQYVQMSDEDKASPEGQALGQLRQTLFMGNTLRGLLLNAYAFDTIATIAGIGAIVAFGAAGLLLILVGIGFWHARRVEHTVGGAATAPVPQPV